MSDEFKSFRCQSGFSSPLSNAAEAASDHLDPLASEPEQRRDMARRRKAERTRLGTERLAPPDAERKESDEA